MVVTTRLAETSDFDAAMVILGPFALGRWPLDDDAATARARTLWDDELCGDRLRGQATLAVDEEGRLLGVATQSFTVAMRMTADATSARPGEYTLLEELIAPSRREERAPSGPPRTLRAPSAQVAAAH